MTLYMAHDIGVLARVAGVTDVRRPTDTLVNFLDMLLLPMCLFPVRVIVDHCSFLYDGQRLSKLTW